MALLLHKDGPGFLGLKLRFFGGAHERIRTADLILTKDVLYQLSYMGEMIEFFGGERETRVELAAFSLEG
jgi:hypothetical protein